MNKPLFQVMYISHGFKMLLTLSQGEEERGRSGLDFQYDSHFGEGSPTKLVRGKLCDLPSYELHSLRIADCNGCMSAL